VQPLGRLQFSEREVLVNNDYEIAIAVAIAYSEGTLQICADQVFL
jgi:hypothetical protein